MKKLLSAYIKEIATTTMRGDAREESYYNSLADLLTDFPLEKGRKTQVTTLPKKTDAGNPDFRIWDGDHFIVGYIEAKTPGTNLDQIETTEQLERYLNTFPNLILTDFYEFRLYRDGQMIDQVRIGRHFTASRLKATPQLENIEEFESLLEKFFAFKLPESFTAERLAIELAKRTRFLRDQVVAEELRDESSGGGDLSGFFNAFKKYLIAGLTPEQFADLYSQTITYGLFAARTRADGEFNRKLAFDFIPPTIGILRDVFKFISLGNLSPQMEVIVDDITAVLNAAHINSILDQYYKEGKGEDPIIHFYETFLNAYDPDTRERRGVYYTPEPVVKYIVKSVHELLKIKFNLQDGLADPSVTVLDPAAGTLTFPAEAIKLAVSEYVGKYGEGGRKNFIKDQILKNFYAFELMMAPYAIGHMKISILLESLGYVLEKDDRFQLYLTNTLEMEEIDQIDIPGLHSLSEESHLAGRVKKEEPILVIMGNPPYSGISSNINEWTEKLLKTDIDGAQSYYKVDGKPLGEKKVWLQDDYVKFLRFAQWKIQKAGKGIVAMITNNGYLDNPTFRGMRQSLMKTFDSIYILDLHGNSLKRETTPEGGPDENVFDIRQGVVIALFIKKKIAKTKTIKHEEYFGKREDKYSLLSVENICFDGYTDIQPDTPYYFYIPRETQNIQHYKKWPSLNEIFPKHVSGIVTARDSLAINFNQRELLRKVEMFHDEKLNNETVRVALNLSENYAWKIDHQRKEFQEVKDLRQYVKEFLYRPFDKRFIFYQSNIVFRMRSDVMYHMLEGENLSLCFMRQFSGNLPYTHVLISENMVDNRTFFSSKGIIQQAPLYLYPNKEQADIFLQEKTANISRNIMEKLAATYNFNPNPKEFIAYVYAILYSLKYREMYDAFLRIDFPRVPFAKDVNLFKGISDLGHRLIELHLLKGFEMEYPTVKFYGQGENAVIGRPKYDESEYRVYINKDFYFEGVMQDVWEYQIGGYQVMKKYLKDRKGRRMDDPRHYIHIATALEKTIEIQKEIDNIYPEVEKDVIKFN